MEMEMEKNNSVRDSVRVATCDSRVRNKIRYIPETKVFRWDFSIPKYFCIEYVDANEYEIEETKITVVVPASDAKSARASIINELNYILSKMDDLEKRLKSNKSNNTTTAATAATATATATATDFDIDVETRKLFESSFLWEILNCPGETYPNFKKEKFWVSTLLGHFVHASFCSRPRVSNLAYEELIKAWRDKKNGEEDSQIIGSFKWYETKDQEKEKKISPCQIPPDNTYCGHLEWETCSVCSPK